MSDETTIVQENSTVEELCSAPEVGLDLQVAAGRGGLGNRIRSPRIQKLGMALAGYTGYIHPHRVQIFGGSEMNYLQALDAEARRTAIRRIEGVAISCIVVTKGLDTPSDLLELAERAGIPVLTTRAVSSAVVSRISGYLEERLAPRITIHGVLLEVFGLGILLLGPSGIGKSECALELVLKGHRLVADDLVEIRRRAVDRLVGEGSKVLEHHMELRGLGIIDIKELFGISATAGRQAVDLAVRLQRWKPEAEYDRLGLDQSSIEFLGVSIPLIEMPIAPGRNVAALVEVAARLHLLRQRGYHPKHELLGGVPPKPCISNQT